MIFGRARAKVEEFILGEDSDRPVEQETVKRWQDIAAQAWGGKVTEFLHDKDSASWPAANERYETQVVGNTIDLIDIASEQIQLDLSLEELREEPKDYFEPVQVVRPAASQVNTAPATAQPIQEPEVQSKPIPVKVPPSDLSLSTEEDLKRRFGANICSALGSGTVIEGTFKFDSPVCIDGTLIGEVSSTSVLIVGEQANVQARIKVGSLIILGNVVGDIDAGDLVEIRSTGRLQGDILTRRVAVQEGGVFNGSCNILD